MPRIWTYNGHIGRRMLLQASTGRCARCCCCCWSRWCCHCCRHHLQNKVTRVVLLDDTYCAAQQKGRQGHAWRHILRCAPYAPSRGWWCYSTEAVSHRRHMHPAARPARRCPMRLPQALGRQEFGGCEAGDVQDETGEGRQAGARQEREQGGATTMEDKAKEGGEEQGVVSGDVQW